MAGLTWRALSEIVAGKIITGSLSESAINPKWVMGPYDKLVERAQKAKKRLSGEEIITILGVPAYQSAIAAADATQELPDAWAGLIQQAAQNHELAEVMRRTVDRMSHGEAVDFEKLRGLLDRSISTDAFEVLTLDQIEIPKNYTPFTLSGYEPIDHHVGGWPNPGLTLIAAPPGTGKTFLALTAMEGYARLGKRSLFFSIEQNSIQIAHRARNVVKMPKAVQKFISIFDTPVSVDDVVRIVTQLEGVEMVVIDFAELLVEGDDQVSSEQIMTYIYRKLARLAKTKNIVIILLAQFNRANYTQMSLSGIRYSGAAEQMASLILFLYNPSQMYFGLGVQTNGHVALDPNSGALIVAKSRHGFKYGFPIAIEVPWTDRGWGPKSIRYHQLGG